MVKDLFGADLFLYAIYIFLYAGRYFFTLFQICSRPTLYSIVDKGDGWGGAAKLSPQNAQKQYVYAVAIWEKDPKKAIDILKKSLKYHRSDLHSLYGAAYQIGQPDEAKVFKEKFDRLSSFVRTIK